jgi:hypothetical protein
MKRNTKFLLALLFSMSALVGLGLFTGCGDDTTNVVTNPPDTPVDSVIGTIHGQVQDAWDGALMESVWVYWTHKGVRDSAMTDARGLWSTGPTLSPGNFNFTFTIGGYATALEAGTIRSLDQLTIDHSGTYTDEAVVDIVMYPMNGGLQGRLYEALPVGSPKDGDLEFKLDDPNLLGVVAGVTVTLDYSDFNIVPNKYTTTTDENGLYSFTNVPAAINSGGDMVKLTTAAFQSSGQTFGATEYDATTGLPALTSGMTVAVPNIYAPVQGEAQLDLTFAPVVLEYNFIGGDFGVTTNIVVDFSDAMNPDQTTVTFKDGPLVGGVPSGAAVAHTKTWATDYKQLTIDPVPPLTTGSTYSIKIEGKSADGRTLKDADATNDFKRNIYTQPGIELLSANFVEFGAGVNNFALDANIWLVFDMTPDTTVAGTYVRLRDVTDGNTLVEIAWTNPGDTIKINPVEDLFTNHEYKVEFKVYSSLPGDYASDAEDLAGITFETISTVAVPGQVTNFALNYLGTKKFNFNDTLVKFKWDPVDDADEYEIYAKNNKSMSNYIPVLAEVEHADHLTSQVGTVDFTNTGDYPSIAGFDIYTSDDIVTPFTNGAQVTFKVRAVNSAGAGPWSSEITVRDEVKPTPAVTVSVPDSTVDEDMYAAYVTGEGYNKYDPIKGQDISADASDSDTAYTVRVWFDEMEYLSDNVTISFIEGGGDPDYVLPAAAAEWNWQGASTRDGYAEITVPAGKMAAVDTLAITFTDNSGNDTTIYHQLLPVLTITAPTDTTSNFHKKVGVDDFTVKWTYSNHDFNDGNQLAGADSLDLLLSVDGGVTWFDTTDTYAVVSDGGGKALELATVLGASHSADTIRAAAAKLGLKKNGCDDCFIYTTESFVWGGLKWTIPAADSTAIVNDDSTYYDADGFIASTVPLTFEVIGLDSVIILINDQAATVHADTIYPTDPTVLEVIEVDFTPPQKSTGGADYTGTLFLQKAGGAATNYEPREELPYTFDVVHDYMEITNPAAENVPGGVAFTANSGITWTYVGPDDAEADLWYIPDGSTVPASEDWTDSLFIATVTLSEGAYNTWIPPANAPSDNVARILAVDMNGDSAHASPVFTVSGIDITWTAADVLVGAETVINFNHVGAAGVNGKVYFSCDGFTSDSTLLTATAGGANFTWSEAIQIADATRVTPCMTAQIRIWGSTDVKTYATTDPFEYEGYIVTKPDSSDHIDLVVDSTFTVTWTTVGDAEHQALNVDLAYTYNGGTGWNVITTDIPNTGSYSWPVPNNYNMYSDEVQFRVYKTGVATSAGVSDTVAVSAIKITAPGNGATVDKSDLSNAFDITWDIVGDHHTMGALYFQYSSDNGSTWAPVDGAGSVNPNLGTFEWDITAIATTATYKLRVREANRPTIWYVSDGTFTVQD